MLQHLIVGLVVAAAAIYSVWLVMPATVRRAGAGRLASLARRCGVGEEDAQRLQVRLATHSSCGECNSCKGCAAPAPGQAIVAMPQAVGGRLARQPRGE
jgi:hypothetical protein